MKCYSSVVCRCMYDAYQGAPFHLKVDILLYILDYPGIGKMFSISGSGAYEACLWCDKGKCVHVVAIARIWEHDTGRGTLRSPHINVKVDTL